MPREDALNSIGGNESQKGPPRLREKCIRHRLKTAAAAERSLRHAVIWKHLSFGTNSDSGSRFVETLLSILETCRPQGRDTFDFLHQSLTQHLPGHTGPSLSPHGV